MDAPRVPRWLIIVAVAIGVVILAVNLQFFLGEGRTSGPAALAAPRPTPTITPIPPTPTPAPCSTDDGKKVYDLLHQYAQEWDDAVTLANNTPRVALSAQIATLQRIRRDVQAQTYPTCAFAAGTALVTVMDTTIDGFLAFLGQKPDAEVAASFQRAAEQEKAFIAEMAKVVR